MGVLLSGASLCRQGLPLSISRVRVVGCVRGAHGRGVVVYLEQVCETSILWCGCEHVLWRESGVEDLPQNPPGVEVLMVQK